MSEPLRPWRETPGSEAERRAAEVVKSASEVDPRAMDVAHGWDGVLERATKPNRTPWLVPAIIALLALVTGAFLLSGRSAPVPESMVVAATE